jgi:radical SAM superfamily enzyme YgiQ (UPF0313 family)
LNVLFTHGYFLDEDPKEQVIMKPYPPLGILYLAAWLDHHGVENEVFDTTFSSRHLLFSYLLEHRPRILAIYTNLMTKLNVIGILEFVGANLPETVVVLGGPDVTHNVEGYLDAGSHYVVIGEGEQTMLELAVLMGTPQVELIPGIAYRCPDGTVQKNPPRPQMRSLEDLPMPARQKINLQQYIDVWQKAHGLSAISVSTQRGCPYTCRWCSTAVYGQSYRRRSPEAVADEIERLQANYQFDLIWFVDDVFTVSHKWLSGFREELEKRKMKIRFECITRADRLHAEVIQDLKACGCFRVWIGAESGSQRIIDAMDRRVDVQQVRAMIREAKRAGIETGTFIMLGYPGETEDDIRETIDHLKEADPDLFTITIAYPIKGTGLYEEVESSQITSAPWAGRTDRDVDFKRTYPRRYYDYAVRWTVNSVYAHKAGLSGKTSLKFHIKAFLAKAAMHWHRR